MNKMDCRDYVFDDESKLSPKSNNGKPPATLRNAIVLEDISVISTNRSNHRRAGSTGTACESFTTTDDEAEVEVELEPPECSFKDHVASQLFSSNQAAAETTAASPSNSDDGNSFSDLEADLHDQIDMDKLRYELRKAQESLQLKDEELGTLSKIRQDVASELEDLTASLFQEAHNMVRVANERQATAEKALHESQLKVDLLSAEVSALKTLVLTSTPSAPNKHLHPQLDHGRALKHRRCSSTSHFNFKYGRETSPPDSDTSNTPPNTQQQQQSTAGVAGDSGHHLESLEVDPVLHEEFLDWKRAVSLDRDSSALMRRVYGEDLDLCLQFVNKDLSAKVVKAVENGSILIEAIGDKSKTMFPRKCALMEVQRHCHYRMNTGPITGPAADSESWHFISMICRNRIIAVCDFLNYLKYIDRGLVKSNLHDMYWEIVRLRKEMVMARLGLTLNTLR